MPTIVYDKQKVVYCAVEKCAITRLIGYFGTTYFQKGNDIRDLAEQIFYPAKETYKSNIPVSKVKENYPDYFIFSFVRNPFARLVSNYHFNRGKWLQRFNNGKIPIMPTFTEYVLDQGRWSIIQPLVYHIDIEIDFIGKVENFKKDFNKLNKLLGVEHKKGENHPLNRVVNRSSHEHYRTYYNEETKDFVEKKYAVDLERFNYKF